MFSKFVAGSIIIGTMLLAGANASDHRFAMAGEKLDNGLGNVPHYSEWKNHPGLSYLVMDETAEPARLAAAPRQ